MPENAKSNIGIVIEIVIGLLVGLLVYQRGEDRSEFRELRRDVIQIGKKIATVTANRFTSSEGVEVWKTIAKMQAEMNNLPPEKWRERIENIDSRLRHHEMDAADPSPPAPR